MAEFTYETKTVQAYGGATCTIKYEIFEDGTRRIYGKVYEKDGRRAVLFVFGGYMTWGRGNVELTRINEDGTARSVSAFKDVYNAEQKAVKWVLEGKC